MRVLADQLKTSGLDIEFGAQLTGDQILVREDVLQKLQAVGLKYLFVVVETLDTEVAFSMSKNTKRRGSVAWIDRSFTALKLLNDLGIMSCVALVFGLGEPHESRLKILKKIHGWRRRYGFPARLSMNWGVQHPLRRESDSSENYTYHEWGTPKGEFFNALKNYGESSLIYPVYGQPQPILEEVLERANVAKDIVETKSFVEGGDLFIESETTMDAEYIDLYSI